MRIKFLATGSAPDYIINGDKINNIELSEIADKFEMYDEEGNPTQASIAGIREAYMQDGEWHVVLCQMAPVTHAVTLSDGQVIETRGGDWQESDWIDAEDYDPTVIYIKELERGEQVYIESIETV